MKPPKIETLQKHFKPSKQRIPSGIGVPGRRYNWHQNGRRYPRTRYVLEITSRGEVWSEYRHRDRRGGKEIRDRFNSIDHPITVALMAALAPEDRAEVVASLIKHKRGGGGAKTGTPGTLTNNLTGASFSVQQMHVAVQKLAAQADTRFIELMRRSRPFDRQADIILESNPTRRRDGD